MENYPIDIVCGKLLDWLIGHRHCNRSWPNAVAYIRQKINRAICNMPDNQEIKELLRASHINYFHCLEILKILKNTETNTKNFFGFYSSQRIIDWQDIISLYQKDSVYLAEAAQLLQRLMQFEISVLKNQITKAESGVKEAESKEDSFIKQSVNAHNQYTMELKKFGLAGIDLHEELIELTAILPDFIKEINSAINELKPIAVFFNDFKTYVTGINAKSIFEEFPLLDIMFTRFPKVVTYYEWKNGFEPESIDLTLNDSLGKNSELEYNIVFDDEIDFGSENNKPIIDTEKVRSKVATGLDALSVFEHFETRPKIIAQLKVLLSFLVFRDFEELADSPSDIYLCGLEFRPKSITVDSKQIRIWKKMIEKIILLLEDPQKEMLLKISCEPAYVDEIISKLEVLRTVENKFKEQGKQMADMQNEYLMQIARLHKQLKGLVITIKALKENIENEISKRCNDREVYIIGEINNVINVE